MRFCVCEHHQLGWYGLNNRGLCLYSAGIKCKSINYLNMEKKLLAKIRRILSKINSNTHTHSHTHTHNAQFIRNSSTLFIRRHCHSNSVDEQWKFIRARPTVMAVIYMWHNRKWNAFISIWCRRCRRRRHRHRCLSVLASFDTINQWSTRHLRK